MTQNDTLHFAAQYLATAAKSFLPSKPDDSHTNLGWNTATKSLETHDLNDEGLRLTLNYPEYSLDIVHPKSGVGASYPLAGATHFDVLKWIDREAKFCGIHKDYEFDLHYELPFQDQIKDDFTFPAMDEDAMPGLIQLRWLADMSLKTISSAFHEYQEARVWPHHFDTGALGYFDASKNVSIGLGLAIPDVNVDDWYFYVSGYHDGDAIKTNEFKELKNGEWRSGDWNAAVLKATGKSMPMVSSFLNEAVKAF